MSRSMSALALLLLFVVVTNAAFAATSTVVLGVEGMT